MLDTWNFQLTMAGSRPFPYDDPVISLHATAGTLYQSFNDQRLVNRQGQYKSNKPYGRQDFQQNLSVAVGYPRPLKLGSRDFRLGYMFSFNASYNGSNQNSYDAARTMFIYDAYSYYSLGGGPSWNIAWGDKKRPASVNVSFLYNHQLYVGRLAQNTDGLYLGSNQWQDRYTLGMANSYPIAKNFNLIAKANFLWATSNQAYEKTYLYSYRTANYMMGFAYEY